jgi:excinuclease UvrABC ATPase subunit
LAALLGSGLTGVLYILDEPTSGLHQRDTSQLSKVLYRLRDLGNTVLVVEHDLELIRAADYVVDIGPGAGKNGGRIVATGTPQELMRLPASQTGAYLSGEKRVPIPASRRQPNGKAITIYGARQYNLRDLTVKIPLGMMVAVTGVSGSGKSSLVFDILDRAARQRMNGASEIPANTKVSKGGSTSTRSSPLISSTSGASRVPTRPPIQILLHPSVKPLPLQKKPKSVDFQQGIFLSTYLAGAANAVRDQEP